METILTLAIGIVIGWNIPQPSWASDLQAKTVAWFRNLGRKG